MSKPRKKLAVTESSSPLPATDGTPQWDRWVAAGVVVGLVAVALRVAAARGELWLDEVWSIRLVADVVRTPVDIALRLKHDNNHFLNSLVAYLVGPDGESWQYRWPAVVAGSAAVFLAGWAQRRLGRATALLATVLVGASYLAVHYSSEARGYAYLMCFMMLAFGALDRAEETGRIGWEVLFTASCVLGFLAHTLFLTLYLAVQLWTWFPDGKRTDRTALRRLVVAAIFRTVLPGLFFGWLYWVNLSRMQIGGGNDQPNFQIVLQTLSLAGGGPFVSPGSYASAALTLTVSFLAGWHVFRQSPRRGCFYAAVIVVGPAILLVAAPRNDVYPRYFLGSVLFLYLLWSEWLGSIYERFGARRLWIAALLTAYVLANGVHIWQLIALERGHYREVIALMDRETQSDQVNVALDHPFRHGVLVDYYGDQMKLSKSLQTFPPDSCTEWLLVHDLHVNFTPPESLTQRNGTEYRLVREYPFAGLSGWDLCVYRRQTR